MSFNTYIILINSLRLLGKILSLQHTLYALSFTFVIFLLRDSLIDKD